MKKTMKYLISFFLITQLVASFLFPSHILAASLTIESCADESCTNDHKNTLLTNTLLGQIPLNKLGSVQISRGRVSFRDSTMEITAIPEWQFDRQVVLSGPLIKLEIAPDSQEDDLLIKGIAYFTDGLWLSYLDSKQGQNSYETIVANNQATSGHVKAISKAGLEIITKAGEQVNLSCIQDIVSPKACYFSIHAKVLKGFSKHERTFQVEGEKLSLKPASRIVNLTALKSELSKQEDDDLSTSKLILLGTSLSLLQLGQLIPVIALPTGSQHMRNAVKYRELNSAIR